jgi:peptidyl-prolyl cis-trans isomerase B (cyclophilin B)
MTFRTFHDTKENLMKIAWKNWFVCLPGFVLGLAMTSCSTTQPKEVTSQETPPPTETIQKEKPKMTAKKIEEVAIIKTSHGEIAVAFWADVAPKTVENFKKLAKDGFYNGTAFHRIVKGFMIQGGDPLSKDENNPNVGTGNPGYKIKAEFNQKPHVRGVLSMARSNDPDSAGSQFFICLADASFLNGKYTAFGTLIKGDDVLEKLGNTPTTNSSSGEKSKPINRVGVESITIAPFE